MLKSLICFLRKFCFIIYFFLLPYVVSSQINFSQKNLDFGTSGANVDGGVTSLMFGPDDRLYVAEYTGAIKIFTIERNVNTDYIVTDYEELDGILTMSDHNDDGTLHNSIERETLGLTVAGTAENPVVYVTSSDFRIGAGIGGGNGDVDLDTNSGVITRFSWNGVTWDVVDIVRGLPRSEENHATNGLEFKEINGVNYLIVAQGGHTNGGAPSENFVYSCEYALSAAILAINLDMIEAMPIKQESGRNYIYDLPTLDDPTRDNANGITDPNNPFYDGIDIYDPFGGNDGLNQAIIVEGGPVQILSPGYRNAYDLVVTQSGALYVTENGANVGWGGFPVNEGLPTVNNDYDPNELGSSSSSGGEQINNKDHLQLITTNLDTYVFGSYYGGHPNPVRANPLGAGLYTDNGVDQVFRTQNYNPNLGGEPSNVDLALPANWPPVPLSLANVVEADWRGPGDNNPEGTNDNEVTVWTNNTNGIDEYTASNFGGLMQGNLLAGSNSGEIKRVELNENGTLESLTEGFISGLGGNALGITCNSDFEIFPGSIWAGKLNGGIVVLEPQDFVICIDPSDPAYNANFDYDQDGYSNQDEEDNLTDPCNGGSQPTDFDKSEGGILVSDKNDLDDDFDGILDALDPFQIGDPSTQESDAFILPVNNDFFNDQQGLGGYAGLGLTGLMNNGDTTENWLLWLDRTDDPNDPNPNDVLGGAPGLITSHMTSGTAYGSTNTQEKGYQYGVQTNNSMGTFEVIGGMNGFVGPLRLYGNTAAVGGELGFFIGDGTQSNYIKFVVNVDGFVVLQEINDLPQAPITQSITLAERPTSGILFYFTINSANGDILLEYQIDGGTKTVFTTITAQGSILNAIQDSSKDLAVGLIGTSGTPGVELEGTWDFLNVIGETPYIEANIEDITKNLGDPNDVLDLNSYFNDAQGLAQLEYTVTSNTNTNIQASILDNELTLTYPATEELADITIRATDSDLFFVEDTFTVTVIKSPQLLYRINAGGPQIEAIDGLLDWEADEQNSNSIYLSEPGSNSTFTSAVNSLNGSVRFYSTPPEIFETERFDNTAGNSNMTYSFPVTENGNYEVWVYLGEGFEGASNVGERIFNVSVEDFVLSEFEDIDLSAQFGFQVGGVLSSVIPVNDGNLDVSFIHNVQNPLVNAIEIFKVSDVVSPIYTKEIKNQFSNVNTVLDGSLGVEAIGGSGNLSYEATGLPPGIYIEPTNGLIYGTISEDANINSPYQVEIIIDDQDGSTTNANTIHFEWVVIKSTVFRVNAGGVAYNTPYFGLDWEDNSLANQQTGVFYSVNTGRVSNTTNLLFENSDPSLPAYIDPNTFNAIFAEERYDTPSGQEMEYKFPLENGAYQVRIFTGNNYALASNIGDRIFDIRIEDVLVDDNVDLIERFGHEVVGMLTYNITVNDSELNLLFEHEVENPILGAIEVYTIDSNYTIPTITDVQNQISNPNDAISLGIVAQGGDPNEEFTYFIIGQPDGIDIDPLTGIISGIVSTDAAGGGPLGDGMHEVEITVLKANSAPVSTTFNWEISDSWVNKNENQNYAKRHEHSFVQSGNKFYVLGGRENTRTIDIYDYTTDTWENLNDSAPFELHHYQAVEYQGLIWVLGALMSDTFPNEIPASNVWIFDPSKKEWIEGPEIPSNRRRGSAGVVVHNNKIYIVGGNINGHDGGFVAWFDEFDPSTGIWTPLANAPVARDHFFASLIENKMYLAGGRQSGGVQGTFKPLVPQVDVYDFSTDTWSTFPSELNIPTPRAGAAVVNYNGNLLVCGGEVQGELVYGQPTTGALEVTESFDPNTETWSRISDFNNKRHGAQALVSGQGVYVLGGSKNLGGGNQKNMEYYGTDAPTGIQQTGSELQAPGGVLIADGTTENFDIEIVGDTGIYIKSFEITGDNAVDFSISTGNLTNSLLSSGTTHSVEVSLIAGNGALKNAILTINYGNDSKKEIALSNQNIAPVITPIEDQYNSDGDVVSLQVTASDYSSQLNFQATNLPAGLAIDSNTGLISGALTQPVGFLKEYEENSGLLLVEVESEDYFPNFNTTTIDNAIGIVGNTNHLLSQDGGLITYNIKINTPGVYRFNWKNAYNGNSPTDENDSWLRFPNNNDVWFFALKGSVGNEAAIINNLNNNVETNTKFPIGSSRITPGTTPNGDSSNGFFKIYRSGGSSATYNWQARTSDNDAHDIYIYFANAGTYPMEIGERSAGHAIDKFALYKVDDYNNYTANDLDALVASNIITTGTPGASYNSPCTVNIEVSDDGNPSLSKNTEFLWYIDDGANEPPIAIASGDDLDGLAPHTVNFVGENSTDDDFIVSYEWNFGTGDTSNEPNPQYIFNTEGNYQVTLTVSDIQGANSTISVPIIVNTPSGSPTAVATADVTNGIAPLLVNFNGSGSFDDVQIDSYSWDFGDGSPLSNLPNPQHTYNTAGDFTATLIVTDNDGITNFDQIDVTVLPISVTGITVDPPTADILVGENIALTATVLPIDATNGSVIWSSSDDLLATVDQNGMVTALANGMVTITATTNDGEFTASSILTVTNQVSCQWTNLTSSNLNKVESQSAKIGNKLYVFAGFLANLKITGVTEIYDVDLDQWNIGAPMPLPVTHMGIAVVGDEVWIVGGFEGNHPGVATQKVQIYNTLTNTWRYGVDLPNPRASGAAVKNGDNIHYFGGLLPDRVTDVGDHYVLDLNNEQAGWATAAPLPDPRNHLSGASVNGLIYAIGGQFGHDNGVSDQSFLDVYNPNTNTWSRLASLPSARSHFEPGTLVYDNKIIIVGGRRANFFFDDITQYNPLLNQWTELCELPENNLAPVAKAFGNQLIVANGGINGTSNPTNKTRSLPLQPISNQPPEATIVATPISGDIPLTVDFDGSLSNDDKANIVSYSWNFGDGSSASGTTTTHTYVNVGIYTAELTVTDGEGLSDTATVAIEVLPVSVTGVTVNPIVDSIFLDNTTQLTANVLPLNATDSSIIWSSSDDSIATVNTNGLVTANGVGTATITVTTTDGGFTASSEITVNEIVIPVTAVTIDPTTTTLIPSESITLTVTVLPLNATDPSIIWSSSDDSIATVNTNGLVTANGVGTATITVTTTDGGFTASSEITVNEIVIPVSAVTIDPTSTTLIPGESITLTATVQPLNATDPSVIWSSSDDSIAMVNTNGLVTANGVGTATITVTTTDGGFTASSEITVNEIVIPVSAVTIDPTSTTLIPGESITLTATVQPLNATDPSVIWSSSDDSIATVNTNGLVTANGVGTATITVTTTDGGYTASSEITVNPISVSGVTVNPSNIELFVAESATLAATIVPLNATNSSVIWSSSDDSVASVDTNGLVTANGLGSTTITVTTIDGGFTAIATITVNLLSVSGVTVTPLETQLNVGESATLAATILPLNATNSSIIWSSSDDSIASVDTNGEVTANTIGTAIITATTIDGGFTATATIIVNPIFVTGVTLDPTMTVIFVGETTTLTATVEPQNATNSSVVWNSSDDSIATVDANGLVTAIGVGSVRITVTTNDGQFIDEVFKLVVENDVNDLNSLQGIISPNPAGNKTEISFINAPDNIEIYQFYIYNLSGKLVKSISANSVKNENGNYEISVLQLQNTMYHIYVYTNLSSKPTVLKLMVSN